MDESTVQSVGMLFQVTAMYMHDRSEIWYHARCLIDNCVMNTEIKTETDEVHAVLGLVATCGHPDCAMKMAFDHLLMHPEFMRGEMN